MTPPTATPTRAPARQEPDDDWRDIDANGNPVPLVTVETITPRIAADYLERNQNIRRLRPSVVERYAADMAAGNWHVGTSVIGIDPDDNLRCGQHRLAACVKSGKSFTTIISRGLSQAAIDNDDMGLKRTQADILRSRGEVNAPALAAAIANSWRWDNGLVLHSVAPTSTQVAIYLDENPEIRQAVGIGISMVGAPLFARISAIGPFIYRVRQIEPEFADTFVLGLQTGADLSASDPILRLRQYYLAKRSSQYGRPSRTHETAVLVKAWNAWLTGRPVKALRWGRGTSGQEEFPALLSMDGRPHPFPDVVAARDRRKVRKNGE